MKTQKDYNIVWLSQDELIDLLVLVKNNPELKQKFITALVASETKQKFITELVESETKVEE